MKTLILSISLMLLSVGIFAQKASIQDFVSGKSDKSTFVQNMVDHFGKYDLSAKQLVEITKFANKKAENYQEIAELKKNDETLFKKKMQGQTQHTIQYLRLILNEKQYRDFMMDSRVERIKR